jgi:hypothetical protein
MQQLLPENKEIKNTDAFLRSIRFQGYHSNKEYIPFFNNMNCHNNKGRNMYSILPCLREMNRINRHLFYISIDTTYNRFPYITVFVKMWFITLFNANVNMSPVLLRLV